MFLTVDFKTFNSLARFLPFGKFFWIARLPTFCYNDTGFVGEILFA